MSTCNANETAACCCMDIGTILDNTDCSVSYRHQFAGKAQAETMLETLTARANTVASEPCRINFTLLQTGQQITLAAEFEFACQAEALIFQLGLRQV